MTATTDRPASRLSILRNRDDLLFWSGGGLSLAGSAMSGIAFPLLVLAITHQELIWRSRQMFSMGQWRAHSFSSVVR